MTSAVPGTVVKKKRHWGLIAFTVLVVLPVLLFTLYTISALSWTYSAGERVGYLQKFAKKGYTCKTWEGQLAMATMPGVPPQMFDFSVRDDSIAAALNAVMGKRVTLQYKQHKGVPTTCFGETEYFVVGVTPEAQTPQ